ncbi:hypothetical protein F5X68DRAFT_34432 [Plectosphaerella plurivora]|uniref:Uncharacterized protein n=1 Tax=Plectosphaerella plurivora TaxID=936078 RepID=A0A9P8V6Q0_9PEZI|nr:hypothetical protein F5X68DRAFT_34432 [Plectosphaerella plurivora]
MRTGLDPAGGLGPAVGFSYIKAWDLSIQRMEGQSPVCIIPRTYPRNRECHEGAGAPLLYLYIPQPVASDWTPSLRCRRRVPDIITSHFAPAGVDEHLKSNKPRTPTMASVSASSMFARTNDYLCLLADQIEDGHLLARLCRVNWQFNANFTPYLYRRCNIVKPNRLAALPSNGNLVYTKRLSVKLLDPYAKYENQDVAAVGDLVQKMPALEVFEWSGLPLPTDVPHALTSCAKLKAVHITYPSTIEESVLGIGIDDGDIDEQGNSENENYWTKDFHQVRRLFYVQDLSPLTGLESLTINNMYGNLHLWKAQVVSIFQSSPALRELRLSVCEDAVIRCGRSTVYPFDPFGFFDTVCDTYGEAAHGEMPPAPLQLSSLCCGLGVYPSLEASLIRLVDLSSVEVVFFETKDISDIGGTHFFVYDHGVDESFILFDVFLSPEKCPKLRRFSADRLGGSIYARLLELKENKPEFLNRLIIEFEDIDDDCFDVDALVLSGTDGGSQIPPFQIPPSQITPTAWRDIRGT